MGLGEPLPVARVRRVQALPDLDRPTGGRQRGEHRPPGRSDGRLLAVRLEGVAWQTQLVAERLGEIDGLVDQRPGVPAGVLRVVPAGLRSSAGASSTAARASARSAGVEVSGAPDRRSAG